MARPAERVDDGLDGARAVELGPRVGDVERVGGRGHVGRVERVGCVERARDVEDVARVGAIVGVGGVAHVGVERRRGVGVGVGRVGERGLGGPVGRGLHGAVERGVRGLDAHVRRAHQRLLAARRREPARRAARREDAGLTAPIPEAAAGALAVARAELERAGPDGRRQKHHPRASKHRSRSSPRTW